MRLGLLVFILVPGALGWGVDGHHIINRLAGAKLPADVPAFLRSARALDALAYYSPLPDHWRGAGEPQLTKASAPDHYIQLESLRGMSLPRDRYDYVRALAAQQLLAEKIGMQPYQTVEVWERLKVAFRDYRELLAAGHDLQPVQAEVIFLAGWLGHYVGDGSMPLHTSDKPNGWIGPNPNGYTAEHHIHGLFESDFVKANILPSGVAAMMVTPPAAVGDVFDQYVSYLKRTHEFVEQTYQLEKAGAFTDAGTAEGKAFAEERLSAAATELRDLVYTAWIRSGEPVPSRH